MSMEDFRQFRIELLTDASRGFLQLSPDVQECSADPRHFRLDLLRIDLQGLRAAFQNVSRHPGSANGETGRDAASQ